ncbi:glycosyltransferase family 2 protein [Flavobacterium sp. FlaQc-47]|uniref:glycosyltransferase family 2 protein n=1 Tax=Flavobacterium sp. FlaQc-47 TaxID=3374180 RepID=UPI0037576BCB
MSNFPLVTIICLCYNHDKFVVESLNSVLNQTYENIELIIVDDCSKDSSVATIEKWLKNYSQIKFISNKINFGNTKTFNKVLQFANGDYIIDLAADDVLHPESVEKQIHCFQNSNLKNLAVVYGNAEIISENNTHVSYYYEVNTKQKVIKKPATGDIYLSILNQSTMLCSVSSMIKREVLEELDGYDENLAYEDLDLWIRTARNYNFEFIDCVLIKKRKLESSLGSQFYKKFNSSTRKINRSSYLIIKKTITLNKSKIENKALLKRLHYEMMKAYKTYDLGLFLQYVPLELKLRFL